MDNRPEDVNVESGRENKDSGQDNEALVKKRKRRQYLGTIGIIVVILAVCAASIWHYIRTRQNTSDTVTDGALPDRAAGEKGSMVTASGTTSVGMDEITFDIDFLEDTNLYVEDIYLSNGDEVAAGEKYIKFTDESIESARKELESKALSAELSYRNGVISDTESRLEAKYTYDTEMLEAQYAQQVYDDTLAQLDAALLEAQTAYEDAQAEYDTYYNAAANNTFYEDYQIAELKKAYEDAYDLYVNRKEYWEVTDDELSQSSTDTTQGGTGTATSSTENAASGQGAPSEGGNAAAGQNSSGSNARSGGTGSQQNTQNDRNWILKTVTLLEEEATEAKEEYEQAQEDYETEIAGAERKLQKLLNQLETAREDYTDATVTYQKESLSARTTYETAVAKGQTAKNDYDTQLASLDTSLERLKDEKEEAQENLELFESLIGDGYLYTQSPGTVVMLRAEAGQTLNGGDMIMAYSNSDKISVQVSVLQEDIAKLSVGDSAQVMIEDYGSFDGVITSINPVASSDSKTSVTYVVSVGLEGDVSTLSSNLTATVIFGSNGSEETGEWTKTRKEGN